jgi:hypothetical protein
VSAKWFDQVAASFFRFLLLFLDSSAKFVNLVYLTDCFALPTSLQMQNFSPALPARPTRQTKTWEWGDRVITDFCIDRSRLTS